MQNRSGNRECKEPWEQASKSVGRVSRQDAIAKLVKVKDSRGKAYLRGLFPLVGHRVVGIELSAYRPRHDTTDLS